MGAPSKSEDEKKEAQRRLSLAWYYRNRERLVAAKRARRASMTEVQREKERANRREWYAENVERIRAKRREKYKEHAEEMREKARANYSAERARAYRARPEVRAKIVEWRARAEVKARSKVTRHEWYERNKEKTKRQVKEYRDTHPLFREYLREKTAWLNAERDERCRVDASYYAATRAYDRKRKALKRIRDGKAYKPAPWRRKFDWQVKGESVLSGAFEGELTEGQKYDAIGRGLGKSRLRA